MQWNLKGRREQLRREQQNIFGRENIIQKLLRVERRPLNEHKSRARGKDFEEAKKVKGPQVPRVLAAPGTNWQSESSCSVSALWLLCDRS